MPRCNSGFSQMNIWWRLIRISLLGISHALSGPRLECWKFLAMAYSVVLFSLLATFASCVTNLLMQEMGCTQSRSEGICGILKLIYHDDYIKLPMSFLPLWYCPTLRADSKINVWRLSTSYEACRTVPLWAAVSLLLQSSFYIWFIEVPSFCWTYSGPRKLGSIVFSDMLRKKNLTVERKKNRYVWVCPYKMFFLLKILSFCVNSLKILVQIGNS